MPATHAALDTLAKLLKFRYAPRIHKQFITETKAFSRMEERTSPQDFDGDKAVIAAHYQRSEAVGARAEGAAIPKPQYQKFENFKVDVARLYGKIKLSRPVLKATKSNAGTFARAMEVEVNGIKESLSFDVARQAVHGDGTGRITQISPGATSVTQTVLDVNNLRVGMKIDIYDSTGATKRNTAGAENGVEITDIDPVALTITLATSQATTTNDYIYREDSKGQEMMGWAGIADDGTLVATFQNLARSTNKWLKCNVLANSGTARPITPTLIDRAFFESDLRGGGGYPTCIFSRGQYAIAYGQALQEARRFIAPTMTLDGGMKAVQYSGPGGTAPWVFDRMVRKGQVFFMHEPDLARWQMSPVEFIDEDGSMWQRALDGTDAFEAVIATYQQVGAHRCNRHTILKDIEEPV